MRWLQLNLITPHNLLVPFLCWTNEARNKKTKNGFRLIWNASIWTIWKRRNDTVFNNGVAEVDDLVENI